MTDAELAAERLAALLDAEREIERLRERLEIRIQHCHNLRTMLESATDTERAAVVAWLREQDATIDFRPRVWPMADAIERGEHRREEER